MAVPFVDIRTQEREIRTELDDAVKRVLDSGRYVLGDEVAAFEDEFAAYCSATECVGVGSGTDALVLALLACGVGPGDEVIIPAFGFVATAFVVLAVGAVPVLLDVEEDSALLDVDLVEAAINERTRAVIPVHLYGRCMDLSQLTELCASRGLPLIEDAAQAHGARLDGRAAGSFGAVGCFSFYPSKNLGADGDAGAVVTSDPEIAERLRLLRNYGQTWKYRHGGFGTNSRLDEIQAAILRAKLRHLDGWNTARRDAAATYSSLLDARLQLPGPLDETHVFHLYVVRTQRRNRVRRALAADGIATQAHYPVPLHRQPALRDVARFGSELRISERWAREALSLPMFPTISGEQIAEVAMRMNAVVAL